MTPLAKSTFTANLNLFDEPTINGFNEPDTNESDSPKTTPDGENTLDRANLGTFRDSLRAPVHRWFTYPAGFSYQAVEEALRTYGIKSGMTVYDPFAGTGTTLVVAKQRGVNSFGVEAHPFVQFVARTKLYWEFDFARLTEQIDRLIGDIQNEIERRTPDDIPVEEIFPELVQKCYTREKLARLYICREAVEKIDDEPFRNLAKLGLTNLLRAVADVATGWPYIAPNKEKNQTKGRADSSREVAELFWKQLRQMQSDLQVIRARRESEATAKLIAGDSRKRQEEIESNSVDLSFCSPPYLNNYDYADRTRLETYFWGFARTWGDITEKVRTKLIMSATTQINRKDYDEAALLDADFNAALPDVAAELTTKVGELSKLRLTKGGKKSYDIMVAGYFNDMLRVTRETFRILKPGSRFVMILGDSAPYGVHIPTDIYLGEVGKAVGFEKYEIEDLRTRGGKWKDNPQRHTVELKESILTLYKA